jgi:hypothetical protein
MAGTGYGHSDAKMERATVSCSPSLCASREANAAGAGQLWAKSGYHTPNPVIRNDSKVTSRQAPKSFPATVRFDFCGVCRGSVFLDIGYLSEIM